MIYVDYLEYIRIRRYFEKKDKTSKAKVIFRATFAEKLEVLLYPSTHITLFHFFTKLHFARSIVESAINSFECVQSFILVYFVSSFFVFDVPIFVIKYPLLRSRFNI